MIKVISVNSSEVRGIRKTPIDRGFFKASFGLVGDGHASSETHKQISLAGIESYKRLEDEENLFLYLYCNLQNYYCNLSYIIHITIS